MNKDNVRKWVAALRSGEYKQCSDDLYVDGRHCCLGVACEVAGIVRSGFSYDGEQAFLPLSAQDWLGIDDNNPVIGEHRATYWNDLEEKTFPEIADLIEKYWLDSEPVVEAK